MQDACQSEEYEPATEDEDEDIYNTGKNSDDDAYEGLDDAEI